MKASNLAAPYDSVFKTLITDAKELLIPFINEIFKTATKSDGGGGNNNSGAAGNRGDGTLESILG